MKKPKALEKPVHFALMKQSPLQKRRLPMYPGTKATPPQFKMPEKVKPVEEPYQQPYMMIAQEASKSRGEMMKRTSLRVIHNSVPPLAKDKIPPCETCVTAACCKAFLVPITPDEYDSGLYGDQAVKITVEDTEHLNFSQISLIATMHVGNALVNTGEDKHYLEGPIGQACPFLQEDNRCGIYDIRPITCRVYSCVDDDRITDEVRSGEISVEEAIFGLKT